MRIIFLDIDGVLNSLRYFAERSSRPKPTHADGTSFTIHDIEMWVEMLDPEAVARLNRVVEATGACIVVSSSWRHHNTIVWFQEVLGARGFMGQIHDKTPDCVPQDPSDCDLVRERGGEIKAWLDEAGEAYGVTSYVVLDDCDDMTAVQGRFVQTTLADGLMDEHVEKAIALLLDDVTTRARG